MNLLDRIRKSIFLIKGRFHIRFQVERKGLKFRIIVHEKYRRALKWLKWGLAVIGIAAGSIAFSSVLTSVGFSFLMWFIGWLIERFGFGYTAIYVHAMPSFNIEPAKWLGVSSGYGEMAGREIDAVGMYFNEDEYALKVYRLILAWNDGNLDDPQENICTSIILRSSDAYVFFVYPNPMGPNPKSFFDRVKSEHQKSAPDDVLLPMFLQTVWGKECKITPSSYIPRLIAKYRPGDPYLLEVSSFDAVSNKPRHLDIPPIRQYALKIKRVEDLKQTDIEYSVLKLRP